MREFNKIFGIGFPRTGTCSLAAALYELGLPCVHYPTDEGLLSEYRAFCDITVAFAFKENDKEYPGSLFIFTERTDFRSFHKSLCKIFPNFYQVVPKIFDTEHTPEGVERAYNKHKADVCEHFNGRMDQVLFLNIVEEQDPYKKLCDFLGLPYPQKDFPKLNGSFIANRVQNILIREDGFVKHLAVKHPTNRKPKDAKFKPTEAQIKEFVEKQK